MSYEEIVNLPDTVKADDPGHIGHHSIIHRALKSIKTKIESLLSTVVLLTGNQTIQGVKTFTSSPIIPTPTASNHLATKDYVDNFAPNVFAQLDLKVPKTRTVSVSAPLTGGGALTGDISIGVQSNSIGLPLLTTSAKVERLEIRHSGSTRKIGLGDFPEGIDVMYPVKLTGVKYVMGTADASGTTTVELRKNGTVIPGTSANAGTNPGPTTIDVNLVAGDQLTVNITAIGTTPGKRLTVYLVGYKV